jgi:hypothetical protein
MYLQGRKGVGCLVACLKVAIDSRRASLEVMVVFFEGVTWDDSYFCCVIFVLERMLREGRVWGI